MLTKSWRNDIHWPSLPYQDWQDTLDTLHMWMQIVGKIKLALCPFINQWWETAFYVTPRGMTTGRIPNKNEVFAVDFDFISHFLIIRTSSGTEKAIPLMPRSVADFYQEFTSTLNSLGIKVSIYETPVEFTNPIPFPKDTKHSSYDKDYVTCWWHLLLQINSIFDEFRTPFTGKSSPIQFFWGSFDLNGTRFSGKKTIPPKLTGTMGRIMRYAENEENFAFGFWPGDQKFPYPAFYSYIYPAPVGFETINTGPSIAYFNKQLSECILPYQDIKKAKNPKKIILNFLETTYTESAKLAGWDIESLKGPVPY
jgi:hypothetical protein